MAWFLFVTALFMFYADTAATDCHSGWLVHGNKCYHFSHDVEDWIEARLVCQSFDSDLVEVDSQQENTFLQQEVNNLSGNFWLAGNDLEEEGVWVWAVSRTPITEYVNWQSGEPNNALANAENCLSMFPNHAGWLDAPCRNAYRYICEKEPGPSSAVIG